MADKHDDKGKHKGQDKKLPDVETFDIGDTTGESGGGGTKNPPPPNPDDEGNGG